MYDDGTGPYTFCKRGRSNCIDQTCNCIDNAKYRAMYERAREREGWSLPRHRPVATAIFVFVCMLIGIASGMLIFSVWVYLFFHYEEIITWVF